MRRVLRHWSGRRFGVDSGNALYGVSRSEPDQPAALALQEANDLSAALFGDRVQTLTQVVDVARQVVEAR